MPGNQLSCIPASLRDFGGDIGEIATIDDQRRFLQLVGPDTEFEPTDTTPGAISENATLEPVRLRPATEASHDVSLDMLNRGNTAGFSLRRRDLGFTDGCFGGLDTTESLTPSLHVDLYVTPMPVDSNRN